MYGTFSGRKSVGILRWGILGLVVFALSVGLGACGGETPWSLNPPGNGSCDVFKLLRDNTKYTEASAYDDPGKSKEYSQDAKLRSPYRELLAKGQELGCLALYRNNPGDNPTVYQMSAVALTDQGEIKSLTPETKKYDGIIRWKLSPPQLKGVNLTMGLYVLRADQLGNKEHAQFCKDMFQRNPQCFPDDSSQPGDCWFWIKINPKLPEDTPFTLEGNQGSCQICSREICGNKVDDDCDGQVDEGCGENDCHHLNSTIPCYKGPQGTQNVGICKEGVRTCRKIVNADNKEVLQWSDCEKQGLPQQEVCNGLDDNCDGQTDEGLKDCCVVGEVRACYTGDPKQAGQGICQRGVEQCVYDEQSKGGKWGSCGGDQKPGSEVCDGKDNDCNGQIDDGLPTKDCQTQQPGECADGQETCVDGKVECRPKKAPQQELCNLKDDDCDGQVDELFQERGQPCKIAGAKGPCENGIKISCQQGQVLCQALYQAAPQELCNDGIDNDCNGKTDEQDPACECKAGDKRACYPGHANTRNKGLCQDGEQVCQLSGKWGPCVGATLPQTEICDGKDNNCDGQVDETFPTKGQLCFIVTGAQGPCTYGRLDSCGTAPSYKPECKAIYTAQAAEICNNGIDDDCDGVIDNSPPCDCRNKSTTNQACAKMPPALWSQGICQPGTQTCNFNGVWSGCLNETPPAIETCDGKDNDCNGKVDDADPKLGTACQVPQQDGECKEGTNQCQSGQLVCVAKLTNPPQIDLCDGKDNDCNGQIDDSDPAAGQPCADPKKKGECSQGKLSCVNGQWTCPSTQTSQAETCNGKDDDCNGQIDDNLTAPSCNSNRLGVCAQATKLCGGVKGWLECQPSDFFRISTLYQEKETLCDDKDNDCDGQVDVDDQGKPLTRPCYEDDKGTPGPTGTRKVGSCKDGQSTCNKGQWGACKNAAFPAAIQCTGSEDRNCNGTPDKDEPACRCADKQAQGELVIRTWGTGKDGSLTVKNTLILDKIAGKELDRTPKSTRTQPDLTYHAVTAIAEQELTVKDASGLEAGDEILLIHMQGDEKRVGTYELLRLQSVDKTKLKLDSKITGTYGSNDNKSLEGQKVMAVRVPQYRRVTITSSGVLTVSPWDGSTGGVLIFRAQELVRVSPGGSISVAALGYRGGAKVSGNAGTSKAGESIQGESSDGTGKQGGGHAGAKGTNAASGGGGSYGSEAKPGLQQDGKPAGSAGKTYGKDSLQTQIYFGSGGGAGGTDSSANGADSKNETGAGGNGGGLVIVIARTLNIAGTLTADGDNGTNAVSFGAALGGGGGGAGGSVHLRAYNLQIYTGAKITAAGGQGGLSAANGPTNTKQPIDKSVGGQGGAGRIDIRLLQLNGKSATSDPKTLASWATTPAPKLSPILQQCVPPAVVPEP